jgi:tRNA(Ile2) C34 agmatinyltransferase TiaS
MKASKIAVGIAKEKEQNGKDFILCLHNLVCPECAGDLKTGVFPSYSYQCKKCTFRFTSAQESELEKRLKYVKQN